MMIGYAMCGSFCTHSKSIKCLESLRQTGCEVLPVVSETVYSSDTRFGSAEDLKNKLTSVCQRDVIHTIVDAEPIGPKIKLDAMIICPCTGNTLAKLALGITDTSVTMAAKAHLRNNRPLVIALATNDALSANLKNICTMLSKKNVYFVPFGQDDPENKPHSLVADFKKVKETLDGALQGKQIEPLIIGV